jgi:ACS family pantothenate transporter-like MFS transporter
MSDPSKKPKSPILGLFKEVFNWYPSSYPAEERKLLLGSISPTWSAPASAVSPFFVCSEHHLTKSVFVKYLDQTNISNAYVSGLKGDFRL